MPTITVDHASKYYYNRTQRRWLSRRKVQREIGVEDVSLTIEQGEFVFIIGSSGAGKSTLLNLLAGRMQPDHGSVSINGKKLYGLKRWRETRLPLLIGYVSQQHTLQRSVTIAENLRQAARLGERKFDDKNDFAERIRKVLGLTGLAGMEQRYPGELTTGEQRRAELARALINSPPILVLDEVVANQSADSAWDLFLLLTEINRMGTTIIMATHNSEYVNMMRRRVITLVHGRVYSDENKGRYGEIKQKKTLDDPLLL